MISPSYESILSLNRLRKSKMSGRNLLTESESDRGRVIFCPAFRRLQQKAQVFSMEPNAAVRSRLTHSFEVSQIGRYIADLILNKLGNDFNSERGALVNFIETACLMHDIGNPPFGHFGEAAIKKWFYENGEKCIRSAIGKPEHAEADSKLELAIDLALADFVEFDGNPQGLRIVTRLQWNTDEFGLNLTMTSLASFMKYIRMTGEKTSGKFTKKAGYFRTEKDIVQSVWDHFGYLSPRRFPLAYIMEAADDIAYCISDLEDSIEKSVISLKEAIPEIQKAYMAKTFDTNLQEHQAILDALSMMLNGKNADGKKFTFTDFRTTLNNLIVEYVAGRFFENQLSIFYGTLDSLIPDSAPPGAILDVLKNFCRQHVYTHESIQLVELAGYTAIRGLLEQCSTLLSISYSRFRAALNNAREDENGRALVLEPKLLKLFPEKYLKVYESELKKADGDAADPCLEWNLRAHLVVDFISGMTDDFAMTTYRTLSGMRL